MATLGALSCEEIVLLLLLLLLVIMAAGMAEREEGRIADEEEEEEVPEVEDEDEGGGGGWIWPTVPAVMVRPGLGLFCCQEHDRRVCTALLLSVIPKLLSLAIARTAASNSWGSNFDSRGHRPTQPHIRQPGRGFPRSWWW